MRNIYLGLIEDDDPYPSENQKKKYQKRGQVSNLKKHSSWNDSVRSSSNIYNYIIVWKNADILYSLEWAKVDLTEG